MFVWHYKGIFFFFCIYLELAYCHYELVQKIRVQNQLFFHKKKKHDRIIILGEQFLYRNTMSLFTMFNFSFVWISRGLKLTPSKMRSSSLNVIVPAQSSGLTPGLKPESGARKGRGLMDSPLSRKVQTPPQVLKSASQLLSKPEELAERIRSKDDDTFTVEKGSQT